MFVLSLARVEHLFTCVVAAEDAAPKPSPEPYRLALARLQRARARVVRGTVVAVEDGLPGIRSARAAGLATVVVGDVPAHVALEADGYVASIAGLTAESLLSLVAPRIGRSSERGRPMKGKHPAPSPPRPSPSARTVRFIRVRSLSIDQTACACDSAGPGLANR
jgi:hypothetical protein